MMLRGIDFGCVGNASGARGFLGEGYWFHRPLRSMGLSYRGATFCAKTTTFRKKVGNLFLRKDGITPADFFPGCIFTNHRKGIVLNAVGLSGPGAKVLFEDGRWQERKEPFFLSFMAIGQSAGERIDETYAFVELLFSKLREFQVPVGLQINFSCPNVGLSPLKLVEEVGRTLDIAAILKTVPLVPKFNMLVAPAVAQDIAQHVQCDGLCISNTVPWLQLPHKIPWKKLFGSLRSPLLEVDAGGGGLSGPALLPLVIEWISESRRRGLKKPIVGCGGITCGEAIRAMKRAGASYVELGSVSILRPWMVQTLVNCAQALYHSSDRVARADGKSPARDGVEQVVVLKF